MQLTISKTDGVSHIQFSKGFNTIGLHLTV